MSHLGGNGVRNGADARAESQRLAPRVELVDLVALDPADLEAKAVGAEIDDGQQAIGPAFARALGSFHRGGG